MKEKKKIAILMDCMNVGGTEKALVGFLNILDYQKYEVTLLLQKGNGELEKDINRQISVKYWKNYYNIMSNNLKKRIQNFQFRRGIQDISNYIKAKKYEDCWEKSIFYVAKYMPSIDETMYDVAVAYNCYNPEVIAKTLYCIQAKKKVLWIHGEQSYNSQMLEFLKQEYSYFERIYCVSESMKHKFNLVFGNEEKTKVFHNCLDVQDILRKANVSKNILFKENAILTVGRLDLIKGQDMIPKTVRLLLDKGHNVTWYLIGEGSLRKKIECEIDKYKVRGHVVLLGTILNPYPYIKDCNIYVQPSLSEGWCLTVQEAKILKKPIVVTSEVVFKEQIIDGENGIISKGKTSEALSESIGLLLEQEGLREKIVKNLWDEKQNKFNELQEFYEFINE